MNAGMVGFLIGIPVGGAVGVMIICLLMIAKEKE